MMAEGPSGTGRTARALRSVTWWLAVVVLGLIALAAVNLLFLQISPLWTGSTRPWGRAGLAFTVGYALVSVAATVAAWRAADSARLPRAAVPASIILLAVAIRVAVAIAFDAPLSGENAIIHRQALGVLDGSCCFSHRPLGYPIALAGAYSVLGIGPAAVESLNLIFAAVTAGVVWSIGRVAWGRHVGAVAATLYAVMPSQVLMVLVPLTEPMYTMLVAITVRLAMELGRPGYAVAAATGATLAAGQYVRATAVSLLAPALALLAMLPDGFAPRLARGAAIVAVFVVLMLPVVEYNLEVHGDLSISTSAYAGWSLYVGANREYDGRWNREDSARFAEFPGTSAWAKSEYAGTLVADRIAEDPEGALRLLPRKFTVMWADERYAAGYALASGPATRTVYVGWLVSQLLWAPLAVLATIGMFVEAPSPRPAALLIGMIVTLVALSHLLLEVHSRYHAYVVPLLCVLAAAGVVALTSASRSARAIRNGGIGRAERGLRSPACGHDRDGLLRWRRSATRQARPHT